jgi:hypothetical protein
MLPCLRQDDGNAAPRSMMASLLPERFAEYRDRHRGETIIVCGCGTSLALLEHPERRLTIGVNDVGRRFTPDYLVVVNERRQFERERYRHVELTQAKAVFTQLAQLDLPQTRIVRFRLGRRGGTERADDTLHYSNNSPYVAVNLARHLGARRIGVIGVDFTDDHFFSATGRHPLACQLPQIDREYAALAEACRAEGVELVNLSPTSRLTALPKVSLPDWLAGAAPARHSTPLPHALRIVSYATTPVAGVPAVLARCIAHATPHHARCVWATDRYGNGVSFEGDLQWSQRPAEAEAEIAAADVVIIHNGKVDARHASLLATKPVVTLAHNYGWNVDMHFTQRGLPGLVVAQYQATLPEFTSWIPVPNPVPLWETAFRPLPKPDVVTICFTPNGAHEQYPPGHRLFWHAKGATTTLAVLDRLARELPIRLEVLRGRTVPHAEALAMKRRAHIVIDECVTGSYHRNSLEGLAAGCTVVNGVGLLPGVAEMLQRCAPDSDHSPFVFATLETLEAVLRELIVCGAAALAEAGCANRAWIERHWNFSTQWLRMWQPAVDNAIDMSRPPQASRREETGMKTTLDLKVSVVIPHGGRERLPLLAATLASLRQAPAVGEVIVVEMSETPFAQTLAARWADRYVFIEHRGAFERARALNAGTAIAKYDIVFWHDNDLLHASNFIGRAADELRARRLDFLIPYSAVHYLCEADSLAVMRGETVPDDGRSVNCLRSNGRGAGWIGCIGAVLREFVQRHGGLIEGFIGWGGEDDAWFHKVSLIGRTGATEKSDQPVFHLYHPLSGGVDPGKPGAANPFYSHNVKLLRDVRAARTAAELAMRFPAAPSTSGRLSAFTPPERGSELQDLLPVWTYWEGTCPAWIRACRRTLARHVPNLRLLGPETFERLRARDPDRSVDLSHLHVAHRADFIRAFLLQRFGGLWIDADCLVMQPLAPVLELLREYDFIGYRARGGVISNAFIGARRGSRIADAYYKRVRQAVANKRRFSWNWLGGDLLTEVVTHDSRGWHELPADKVQPICWSRPQDFLAQRDEAAHERAVNRDAFAYMLSNVELGKRFPEAGRRGYLLHERTFFMHLLRRSLGCTDVLSSIVCENAAAAQAQLFRQHRCESVSGTGSSLQQTAAIRQCLPLLLEYLGVKRLLDAPCGDFNWLRQVHLGCIEYIGVDILGELIATHEETNTDVRRRFISADLLHDSLPLADAILCRDLLPHLSYVEIVDVLRRFVASGARYILVTHFNAARSNQDTTGGAWRPLNLERAPFHFPPPLHRLMEKCTEDGGVWGDKCLAVWRLEDLAKTKWLQGEVAAVAIDQLELAG